ncbi:Nonsense-mediated mRNA decay factor [Trichinella pseudospiralis]
MNDTDQVLVIERGKSYSDSRTRKSVEYFFQIVLLLDKRPRWQRCPRGIDQFATICLLFRTHLIALRT